MATTVLIADDNKNIRTVVKMDLESLGYSVLEAKDGAEALHLITEKRPDLVVLDVMMPLVDGYEVCFQLKQDPTLRTIPVIMLTAKTAKEDKFLGREVGADEYLTKPFDPEELEKAIERILDSRRKGEMDNALTGLPMWQAVKNEIRRRRERHEDFVVIEGFFEPEAFDLFQKKYGNIKADEAIRSAADIFKMVTKQWSGFFLGHSGDNVFFFIAESDVIEKARDIIARKMAETIPFLYDDTDRLAGGVAAGRPGTAAKPAFMKWLWRVSDVG